MRIFCYERVPGTSGRRNPFIDCLCPCSWMEGKELLSDPTFHSRLRVTLPYSSLQTSFLVVKCAGTTNSDLQLISCVCTYVHTEEEWGRGRHTERLIYCKKLAHAVMGAGKWNLKGRPVGYKLFGRSWCCDLETEFPFLWETSVFAC